MTAHRGLFVRQTGTAPTAVGTTPVEARLALAGLYAENAPGVPRQGLLAQSAVNVVIGTGTMSYDVAPINPVITRAIADGVHTPSFTGITNVLTADAPASGSRIDLIWVKQNDAEAGDADNFADLGVTQGMAAPSPSRPTASLPPGAYVIASAVVSAGALATTDATVVITQEWVHTVARGAPIPVRSTAERAVITPGDGWMVERLDTGVIEMYRNGAWGSITQFPGASPYMVHAGTATVSVGVGTAAGTLAVSFPPGFTKIPIIAVNIAAATGSNSYKLLAHAYNKTVGGFTMDLRTIDGTGVAASYAIPVDWIAIQMTPTTAAG